MFWQITHFNINSLKTQDNYMTIDVTLKDGRIRINKNGIFVRDMVSTPLFIDVFSDGKKIVSVDASGRVREYKSDGQFVKDILGTGGRRVRISGEQVVITKSDGRTACYQNGSFVSDTYRGGASSGKHSANGAEELGAAIANKAMELLGNGFTLVLKKVKEHLKNRKS